MYIQYILHIQYMIKIADYHPKPRQGHKLGLINDEKHLKSFLFQPIGILIQKGNAACVLETKGSYGKLEELTYIELQQLTKQRANSSSFFLFIQF